MRVCNRCGQDLAGHTRYCPGCGCSLKPPRNPFNFWVILSRLGPWVLIIVLAFVLFFPFDSFRRMDEKTPDDSALIQQETGATKENLYTPPPTTATTIITLPTHGNSDTTPPATVDITTTPPTTVDITTTPPTTVDIATTPPTTVDITTTPPTTVDISTTPPTTINTNIIPPTTVGVTTTPPTTIAPITTPPTTVAPITTPPATVDVSTTPPTTISAYTPPSFESPTRQDITVPSSVDDYHIKITSAEQIYALGRLLQTDAIHRDFFSQDSTYNKQDDFAMFEYPKKINTDELKLQYLQSVSYILTEDIQITFQTTAGSDYFTGIGSINHAFSGIFNGNGKTITLKANGPLDLSKSSDYGTGLFDQTSGATIANVNIRIAEDFKVVSSSGAVNFGIIVGSAKDTTITDCTVKITDAVVGAEYSATQNLATSIGGIAGHSTYTIFNNCHVVLKNAVLKGTAANIVSSRKYGAITVGGILGFSNPGSNNAENIGMLGNQLYNCTFESKNNKQQDVLLASLTGGNEVTVGGIVGCTFNNIVVKKCAVNVEKGNIVALKTCKTDPTEYGSQAGGIVGRLEHTGEVADCQVTGNYLIILAKSPNNVTCAGGIVGIDMGPFHRDIDSLNNSHFDGKGTSLIKVEITSADTTERDKVIAAGGVIGCGSYIIYNCSAKNVTIENSTGKIGNPTTYIGEIAGFVSFEKTPDVFGSAFNWVYGKFFKVRTPGIYDCTSKNVTLESTDNVQNLEYTID